MVAGWRSVGVLGGWSISKEKAGSDGSRSGSGADQQKVSSSESLQTSRWRWRAAAAQVNSVVSVDLGAVGENGT